MDSLILFSRTGSKAAIKRQQNDRKRGMEFSFQKNTFGTKTKHKVAVLQNIINIANIINMASCLSANTKLIAAPVTHMITTLYTLIPTYLLSFNAGMLTCLVSHAKKAPNIWNMKKVTAWKIALYRYELFTLVAWKSLVYWCRRCLSSRSTLPTIKRPL